MLQREKPVSELARISFLLFSQIRKEEVLGREFRAGGQTIYGRQ
jgi:hypothetical protein